MADIGPHVDERSEGDNLSDSRPGEPEVSGHAGAVECGTCGDPGDLLSKRASPSCSGLYDQGGAPDKPRCQVLAGTVVLGFQSAE